MCIFVCEPFSKPRAVVRHPEKENSASKATYRYCLNTNWHIWYMHISALLHCLECSPSTSDTSWQHPHLPPTAKTNRRSEKLKKMVIKTLTLWWNSWFTCLVTEIFHFLKSSKISNNWLVIMPGNYLCLTISKSVYISCLDITSYFGFI